MSDCEELSEYEKQRMKNIQQNKVVMAGLQLDSKLIESVKLEESRRKRKVSSSPGRSNEPVRRSLRAAGVHPALPPDEKSVKSAKKDFYDEVELDRMRVEKGWKVRAPAKAAATTWRGEKIGSVPGVEVGHVFGEGDYQRLGRQEMAESGFFVPGVQPEWNVPGVGCYAIILNNDNGSNTDNGETCVYVGGGGRHRGQNRTAPQSFHQSWDNLTNASLKLMCDNKQPVRVIRGPKLQSKFRPANGGFRYDGLYEVARAYEGRTKSGLIQCLFELRRLPGQPPLPSDDVAESSN